MSAGKLVKIVLGSVLLAGYGLANNLVIDNVVVKKYSDEVAVVQFDISWENSWRRELGGDPLFLHDAAWVFFKVKAETRDAVAVENQVWEHVVLEGSGVNPEGYAVGVGTAVELVVPEDRIGLFVRRAYDGAGTTAVKRVKALWKFADKGLIKTDLVRMQAFGLEMCYVAEGAFKVGDGGATRGELHEGGSTNNVKPFAITSAGPIEVADVPGKLWGGARTTGAFTSFGGEGVIPAEYPNGYNAFYCMKYEVTQGQYADFLNTLTRVQQATRCVITNTGLYMSGTAGGSLTSSGRNTIYMSDNPPTPQPYVYAVETPDRACNYISMMDLSAVLDWSGLRPMTELEFEKACRGPVEPTPNECAWGSTTATGQTGHDEEGAPDGSGKEVALPAGANCNYGSKMDGPVRVGIYARPGSTREASGASYWGIMELSGNMCERLMSLATARNFPGNHGDGVLAVNGHGNQTSWPNGNAAGSCFRGGQYTSAVAGLYVSERSRGSNADISRYAYWGGRGVRSAP